MRYSVEAAQHAIIVPAGEHVLNGVLDLPPHAGGIVLFAHGSGSSRLSPRNQYVARTLREAGLATLLMDLLTEEEERLDQVAGRFRFDIPHLARRVLAALDWIAADARCRTLPAGLFGASTGAAAALIAAAERPEQVQAIVSRGGRPDLAATALPRVRTPTLLIVGEYDREVIVLNREALQLLPGPRELVIVAAATHLFEEAGALEEVARLATAWFLRHLAKT